MEIDSFKRMQETTDGYKRLLHILADHEDVEGICRLTKKKISVLYGSSYTGTCKKLKFLVKYGQIKQVSGGFVRTGKDITEAKPFLLLQRIIELVLEKPEVYSSFKQQAELLGEPFEEIQTAWGFFAYFFGSKYPDGDDVPNIRTGFAKVL